MHHHAYHRPNRHTFDTSRDTTCVKIYYSNIFNLNDVCIHAILLIDTYAFHDKTPVTKETLGSDDFLTPSSDIMINY